MYKIQKRKHSSYQMDLSQLENLVIPIRIHGAEYRSIKEVDCIEKDRTESRFTGSWTYIINKKIYESKKLPCAFGFKKQKFHKADGFPIWKCYGCCTFGPCSQYIYGESVEKTDNEIVINFHCKNTFGLNHLGKSVQCKRTERIEAKKLLVGMNAMEYKTYKANELLDESGNPNPCLNSTAVFRVGKQEKMDELLNIKKYPGNPLESILLIAEDFPEIRHISTIPFYINYWSENQVKLWNEACAKGNFISVDASGSFVKTPEIFNDFKCSSVFLYEVVTNFQGKIFPVCQTLSSTHNTEFICSWLTEWLESGALVPPLCVMDGAKALLNACCKAFNKMYYKEYLDKCFALVTKVIDEEPPKCLLKRDRAHLIKNIAKLKLFQGQSWIKKDFYLRVIGFLLQVDNLEMFNQVVEALIIICDSHCADENSHCHQRIRWVMDLIRTYDYNHFYSLNINCENDIFNYEEDPGFLSIKALVNDSEIVPVKNKDFINNILLKAKEQLDLPCSPNCRENPYKLDGLSEYLRVLLYDFLAWTNVLHPIFKIYTEVSSSSGSECRFKILRYDLGFIRQKTVQRFLLKMLLQLRGGTKLGRNALKLTNEGKRNIEESEKKTNILKTNFSNTDLLIETYLKYNLNSRNYNIGAFDCRDVRDNILSVKSNMNNIYLPLSSLDFHTLKKDFWVSGQVIDLFMMVNSLEVWKSRLISHISTDFTPTILGDYCDSRKNECSAYKIDFNLKGRVFFPYLFKDHWMLLLVDVEEKSVYHLDPRLESSGERAYYAFLKFLRDYSAINKIDLSSEDWVLKDEPPHAKQIDFVNCGIFIMFFMYEIGKYGFIKSTSLDPDEYREKISKMLVDNVSLVTCLYCDRVRSEIAKDNISCNYCSRWAHLKCLNVKNIIEKYGLDTLLKFRKCCVCMSIQNE